MQPRLVKGAKATRAGVLDGLAWLRKTATKKDFVVMYIGCHGSNDPTGGWNFETADGQTFWGRDIKYPS